MRERGLHGFVARWNRAARGKLVIVGCQEGRCDRRNHFQSHANGVWCKRGDSPAADQCLDRGPRCGHVSLLTKYRRAIGEGARRGRRTAERGVGESSDGREDGLDGLDGWTLGRKKGRRMASVALQPGGVTFAFAPTAKVRAEKQSRQFSTSPLRSATGLRLEDQSVGFGTLLRTRLSASARS